MRAIIDSDYLDVRQRFEDAKVEPIWGWDWFDKERAKTYPEQKMTIFYDDKWIAELSSKVKHTRKDMKEIIKIAQM